MTTTQIRIRPDANPRGAADDESPVALRRPSATSRRPGAGPRLHREKCACACSGRACAVPIWHWWTPCIPSRACPATSSSAWSKRYRNSSRADAWSAKSTQPAAIVRNVWQDSRNIAGHAPLSGFEGAMAPLLNTCSCPRRICTRFLTASAPTLPFSPSHWRPRSTSSKGLHRIPVSVCWW